MRRSLWRDDQSSHLCCTSNENSDKWLPVRDWASLRLSAVIVLQAVRAAAAFPLSHSKTAHVAARSSSLYFRISAIRRFRSASSSVSVARMNCAIAQASAVLILRTLESDVFLDDLQAVTRQRKSDRIFGDRKQIE